MRNEMSIRNQAGVTTFWGISIILMEVVIVFFVFYILYFFWLENPTPTSNILIVRVFQRGEVVKIPSTVNSAAWSQYEQPGFFTVQYPAEYSVSEDSITYGSTTGSMVVFTRQDNMEAFSIRYFGINEDEEIGEAYERLTGIHPGIYQSYTEKVDTADAIIYRLQAGTASNDHIFFLGKGNLFEVPFTTTTAEVLTTFRFVK
ncbi:MAG: hypothetical protein PHY34_04170 [Patescibacteria group bacterium]|nr:hypothetical protein [Patescibacteria group bacterium]